MPQGDLASFPPDSPAQQEAVWAVAAVDAYQWGYDPRALGRPRGQLRQPPRRARPHPRVPVRFL